MSAVALRAGVPADAPPVAHSVLARVRVATRELHDAVERSAGMQAAVPPPPGRVDVGRFLVASSRFVPGLEALLATGLPGAGMGRWMPALNRTAALEHDLGHALTPAPPFRKRYVPDRVETIALLYVLEGSRLGVRTIARRAADEGTSIVSRYLATTLPPPLTWPALCAVIERLAPDEADRLARSATCVFEDVLESLQFRMGTA